MTGNFITAAVAPTKLSIVRNENRAMKLVSADSKKKQQVPAKEKVIISSKGYICAPKHDFL